MVRIRPLAVRDEMRKSHRRMVKKCRRCKPTATLERHWPVRLVDCVGENEKIFVELANDNLKQKFMQQAEDEGFVLNGEMPTKHSAESVMIVRKDYTIGFLRGFVAHLAYYTSSTTQRIDYGNVIIR